VWLPVLVAGAVAGAVVAAAVVPGVAAPAVAEGNDAVMRVTGTGSGRLGPEWGSYTGDPVQFGIDGDATDPRHPSGTFHVVHRKPDGQLVADFQGHLTSLTAVDEVAVVTGVIESADHPGVPMEMVGKPISLTVYDGGAQDRIGWMWGFFGAPVASLQGTAPSLELTEGGFTVTAPGPSRHGSRTAVAPYVADPSRDGARTAAAPAAEGTVVSAVVSDRSMHLRLAARIPAGADATQVVGGFRAAGGRGPSYVEGKITCLAVGGPVAMATGVVTGSDDPAKVGKPVSFALKDGSIDRVGWLWSWSPGSPEIVDCRSTVPFHRARPGGVLVSS
jgi:hypothetical protein